MSGKKLTKVRNLLEPILADTAWCCVRDAAAVARVFVIVFSVVDEGVVYSIALCGVRGQAGECVVVVGEQVHFWGGAH